MTKEELVAVQARCEAAIERLNQIENLTYPIRISLHDIPALLDRIKYLEGIYLSLGDGMAKVMADCDKWKNLAEALKQELYGYCEVCDKLACRLPCGCINSNGWNLDEARIFKSNEN